MVRVSPCWPLGARYVLSVTSSLRNAMLERIDDELMSTDCSFPVTEQRFMQPLCTAVLGQTMPSPLCPSHLAASWEGMDVPPI